MILFKLDKLRASAKQSRCVHFKIPAGFYLRVLCYLNLDYRLIEFLVKERRMQIEIYSAGYYNQYEQMNIKEYYELRKLLLTKADNLIQRLKLTGVVLCLLARFITVMESNYPLSASK